MPEYDHLLIDGYNIIHAWPETRDVMSGDGAVARARLGEMVRIIHDYEGVRTTVVFDGQGEQIEIERPGEALTFSFLFSLFDSSADAVIEQLTGSAKNPDRIVVASADGMIRQTVAARGARILDPAQLADWVKSCHMRQNEQLKRRRGQVEQEWRNNALDTGI